MGDFSNDIERQFFYNNDDTESEESGYYRPFVIAREANTLSRIIINARRSSQNFMPKYDLLHDIPFSPNYDFVGLVFVHMHVSIRGRFLMELVTALYQNKVKSIYEFVPTVDQFEPEPDAKFQPCIEEISIIGASSTLFLNNKNV